MGKIKILNAFIMNKLFRLNIWVCLPQTTYKHWNFSKPLCLGYIMSMLMSVKLSLPERTGTGKVNVDNIGPTATNHLPIQCWSITSSSLIFYNNPLTVIYRRQYPNTALLLITSYKMQKSVYV